jgi:hypothetical protein
MAHKQIPIEQVVAMLEVKAGFISETAKALGISYQALSQRIKKNKELAKMVDAINETKLDFSESKLFVKIQEGDIKAITFHLERKGGHRGWGEKHTIGGEGPGGTIPVRVTVRYAEEIKEDDGSGGS